MNLEQLISLEKESGLSGVSIERVIYHKSARRVSVRLCTEEPDAETRKELESRLSERMGAPTVLQFLPPIRSTLSSTELAKKLPKEETIEIVRSKKTSVTTAPSGFVIGRIKESDVASWLPLAEVSFERGMCTTRGCLAELQWTMTKTGYLIVSFDLDTPEGSALRGKAFIKKKEQTAAQEVLQNGITVYVRGRLQYDEFAKENLFSAEGFMETSPVMPMDDAPVKRVELSVHTQMSNMEGLIAPKALQKRLESWGHRYVGITDRGSVQAYPLVYEAFKKSSIQPIYGYHAKILRDEHKILTCLGDAVPEQPDDFTVFDIETTGFSPFLERIIEIGAVRYKKGKKVGEFSEFVHPKRPIPARITELTSIDDAMVAGADPIESVLPRFLNFARGSVFVAHNADFDIGFLRENARRQNINFQPVYVDTLGLARCLHPEYHNHKLDTLTKKLGVVLVNHHRACDDAQATGEAFLKLFEEWREKGMAFSDINRTPSDFPLARHENDEALIYCATQAGLKNLYALVSRANMDYFFHMPGIPQSLYRQYSEGLLIGSGFVGSALFAAVSRRLPQAELLRLARSFDFLVVEPDSYWEKAVQMELAGDQDHYRALVEQIIQLAEQAEIPVFAIGMPCYLDAGEKTARNILANYQRRTEMEDITRYRLFTTSEMMAGFSWLPKRLQEMLVLEAPLAFAEGLESICPIPEGTFTPKLAGAEEELRDITRKQAQAIYGDPLPAPVAKRLQREIDAIVRNGYASLYVIARRLVLKSNEDGYLVGSRGSVGSSFAATMAGITEVNPLVPHYVCPNCKHSEFFEKEEVGSGFDLPKKSCPECGTAMHRDGHDIPFEVFLGFHGDKEPDIDLNFAGEYMPVIHKYTETLFGEGKVFRAGTISGIQSKTAYGYIKKYLEQPYIPEADRSMNEARIHALQRILEGTKRTTGQHAGGLMIVPQDMDILDFCPIQYPADDPKSGVVTTHFSYKNLSGRMLKLDELGHTSPTIIRQLEEMTGLSPLEIAFDDPETMALFRGASSLKSLAPYSNESDGSLGIPEFGTGFVRGMLKDTMPSTFAELVRIAGLSHGTDVWLNNAQKLIEEGTIGLTQAICTRDDIMISLIARGMDKLESFQTMEAVRKGRGIPEGYEDHMRAHGVPEWYIDSCNKIQYMFPKAHAVAYVMMSYRIAWFKVHRPTAFYATYFTQRLSDFSTAYLFQSLEQVQNAMQALRDAEEEVDAAKWTLLEVIEEMYARGYRFARADLYHSQATAFDGTDEHCVLPPLAALDGLSEAMARSLVDARADGKFLSQEEMKKRANLPNKCMESMREYGLLDVLPQTNQMSFFG